MLGGNSNRSATKYTSRPDQNMNRMSGRLFWPRCRDFIPPYPQTEWVGVAAV